MRHTFGFPNNILLRLSVTYILPHTPEDISSVQTFTETMQGVYQRYNL